MLTLNLDASLQYSNCAIVLTSFYFKGVKILKVTGLEYRYTMGEKISILSMIDYRSDPNVTSKKNPTRLCLRLVANKSMTAIFFVILGFYPIIKAEQDQYQENLY